jgi:hypothetical protein
MIIYFCAFVDLVLNVWIGQVEMVTSEIEELELWEMQPKDHNIGKTLIF